MTKTQTKDDGPKGLVLAIMDHCYAWLAQQRAGEAKRFGFEPKPPADKEPAVTLTHP
jgi:hypothetical protein